MKTREAPLWTNEEPVICPKCNANRAALFALAKTQEAYQWEYRRPALDVIEECSLCAAAWKKEKDRA